MKSVSVREPHDLPAKPACPMCRSREVSTTSKTVSEATYWRCHTCGEIWNQSRLVSFRVRRP